MYLFSYDSTYFTVCTPIYTKIYLHFRAYQQPCKLPISIPLCVIKLLHSRWVSIVTLKMTIQPTEELLLTMWLLCYHLKILSRTSPVTLNMIGTILYIQSMSHYFSNIVIQTFVTNLQDIHTLASNKRCKKITCMSSN